MAVPSEFQQLRELLLTPEVTSLNTLQQDLEALQRQVQDPVQLSRLLEPVLVEMIRRRDPATSLAILKTVTPLLDQAIREKIEQDRTAMTQALAPASTEAIAIHYANTPASAARDLAPLVGAAIKEQIRSERDAVIDALYPVIGSTISKYLSETLNTLVERMNERIESHLSLGAISRKIRSRVTGVSEAELLLRDSLWCTVDAAFLIHKASGLVIAQSQNQEAPALDSDLLSGMLTAIRSLFNESMNTGRSARELDQIEYGESRIVLEGAGTCYVAAVLRGIPNEAFRTQLRETVSMIVQLPGEHIAEFVGDVTRVPDSVGHSMEKLVRGSYGSTPARRSSKPRAVIAVGLLLLIAACIPLGVYLYRNNTDRNTEIRTMAVLRATDSVSFRDVTVEANRGVLRLTGSVANEYQRERAGLAAGIGPPAPLIENHIAPGPAPPFPVLLTTSTGAITSALNTMDGVYLDVQWKGPELIVSGIAPDSSTAENIRRTFADLPGLRSFQHLVSPGRNDIAPRLLFDVNSIEVGPAGHAVLKQVHDIVEETPWSTLRIIGHSDLSGDRSGNQRIALGRARAAQAVLLRSGIPAARMIVEGNPAPPPGSTPVAQDSLSRCVRFTLLSPDSVRRQ